MKEKLFLKEGTDVMDELMTPASEDVLAVKDLTRRIKRLIEAELGRVWVRGEVSNLRRQGSGHVYFSLKDEGSQLPCVFFARDAAQQSFELEDGMELILFGELSVYEPHGRYQLIGKIAIRNGEGRLQLEYERLKRKLAAEGLFDSERKKPFPLLPSRIAVITSATGAALRDFLKILSRRAFSGEVVIFPARVQGSEAPGEIRKMLAHACAGDDFDLIVLTRGGGSIEDLWAFNDEALARAIAACPIHVVSAIGHEIDHVLTDFASDRRAETPSGAAELISSTFLDAQLRLKEVTENLNELASSKLDALAQVQERFEARLKLIAPRRQIQFLAMRLDEFDNRLRQSAGSEIQQHKERVSKLGYRLKGHHPLARFTLQQQSLRHAGTRLQRAKEIILREKKRRLQHARQRLKNNSFESTLQRGYSILEDENGEILDRVEKARKAPTVRARMRDGIVNLRQLKNHK